jgi:hypothetical protein
MSFRNAFRGSFLTFIALTLTTRVTAAEQRNLILLVPEAMQSANVSDSSAPTLARLRAEGVYFINSYSGFPDLAGARHSEPGGASNAEALVAAAASASYSTALVDDDGAQLSTLLNETLQRFKEADRPFLLVYRLHALANMQQSPAKPLMSGNPGGEGAAGTILLATDHALAAVEGKLRELGLYDATNIIVAAERGRSTIWKASRTSPSLELSFKDVPAGNLPAGFLAIDLLRAILVEDAGLSLFDPDNGNARVNWWAGVHPRLGNAVIAVTPSSPHVEIEARGGYDLIYLPEHLARPELTRRAKFIVEKLFSQDYVSGVFVNEKRVGRFDGALSLKHLAAHDETGERLPDIVVNFVSSTMNCGHPTICAVAIADTPTHEGHDIAVGLSRAETSNFMAARGPDFRANFISRAPASNRDIALTIDVLLRLNAGERHRGDGRELTESLRGSEKLREVEARKRVIASTPTEDGNVTEVHLLSVGSVSYFLAAGAPGRSVGVPEKPSPADGSWHFPRPSAFRIDITPN